MQTNSPMRYPLLFSFLLLVACNNNEDTQTTTNVDTLITTPKKIPIAKEAKPETVIPKTYSNERFRHVTVERVGRDTFFIRGQGQIFEANFNWIVEDGHEELKKGFDMTDAGAPAWGKFEFGINVRKQRENSTLMLILFESSAKDGSRQHQLPIPLN